MAENTIVLNLRRLRKANGITQVHLAERSRLSTAAYQNIETGKSEPQVSDLRAIATALKVPIEQLVAPVRTLQAVRFRSKKRMGNREQILADVGFWLSDFGDMEEILDDRVEYKLDDIRERLKVPENRDKAAATLARKAFGLNTEEPVRDICGLLESSGVKVGEQKVASDNFFGLSAAAKDGGPAVVVNTLEDISVERWIFTAAHELGHLLLHLSDYDVAHTDEGKKHEEEANAFAAAFLMPDESFQKKWDETSGLAFVDRVLKVKRIFGVSYRTVLFRLAPRYRGSGNIWRCFYANYKRRPGQTLCKHQEPDELAQDAFRASFPAGEPDHLSPVAFTQNRLSRLVRQAVEQEKISLNRGAKVLGLSLQDMRDLTASWIG